MCRCSGRFSNLSRRSVPVFTRRETRTKDESERNRTHHLHSNTKWNCGKFGINSIKIMGFTSGTRQTYFPTSWNLPLFSVGVTGNRLRLVLAAQFQIYKLINQSASTTGSERTKVPAERCYFLSSLLKKEERKHSN